MAFAGVQMTLLVVSLALLVAAAPAKATERHTALKLTPDNFASSISTGPWFIEFFSPYCPHCRGFEDTWKDLGEYVASIPDHPVALAQVNCATYGDLCNQQDVQSYPTLNLYQDGKYKETFTKERNPELLRDFLSKFTGSSIPTSDKFNGSSIPTSDVDPVKTNDPQLLVNPTGDVLVLTNQNFANEIGKGRVFVKFFAPWCGHCKKLAPTWKLLAGQMKNQLTIAEVDCEEHNSLCRSQDVKGYPMLIYYDADGGKSEYTGGRQLQQLSNFVEKLLTPAVQEITYEAFDAQVRAYDVLYLLLRSSSDTRISTLVTKASVVLLGSPPVFESTSESLISKLAISPSSLPVLVAFKDNDIMVSAAMMQLKPAHSVDDVKVWFLRHRLPTVVPLDSENFQQIMNPQHLSPPLVLIAAVSEKNSLETRRTLKVIGKKWREEHKGYRRDVVFTWMDAGKWSQWLKGSYGITGAEEAEAPPIVIADHNHLIYYDVDATNTKIALTTASIEAVLDGIFDGSISYQHSENMIERLARFLNDKLVSVESFVTNNIRTTIMLAILGFVLFMLFLRWMFSPGEEEVYVVKNGKYEKQGNDYLRKSNRLD